MRGLSCRIPQKRGVQQPRITWNSGIQQSSIRAELGWDQAGIGSSEVPGTGIRVGTAARRNAGMGF